MYGATIPREPARGGCEYDAVCRCAYHRAHPITGQPRAYSLRSMRRRERQATRRALGFMDPADPPEPVFTFDPEDLLDPDPTLPGSPGWGTSLDLEDLVGFSVITL